jgi:hypothetical protein
MRPEQEASTQARRTAGLQADLRQEVAAKMGVTPTEAQVFDNPSADDPFELGDSSPMVMTSKAFCRGEATLPARATGSSAKTPGLRSSRSSPMPASSLRTA